MGRNLRPGQWDFLASEDEAPRHALIAGYANRLAGGGLMLDVGCGEGVLLDSLDLSRVRYRGFDISSIAVERARTRAREGDVQLFTASMDDFQPDERFKFVVFNELWSHSPKSIETLYRYF